MQAQTAPLLVQQLAEHERFRKTRKAVHQNDETDLAVTSIRRIRAAGAFEWRRAGRRWRWVGVPLVRHSEK